MKSTEANQRNLQAKILRSEAYIYQIHAISSSFRLEKRSSEAGKESIRRVKELTRVAKGKADGGGGARGEEHRRGEKADAQGYDAEDAIDQPHLCSCKLPLSINEPTESPSPSPSWKFSDLTSLGNFLVAVYCIFLLLKIRFGPKFTRPVAQIKYYTYSGPLTYIFFFR